MQCPLKTSHDCDLLLDYCAHKLSSDAAVAFEQHMSTCEECSRVAAEQERVWSALETWEVPPVSLAFDRRLYSRIEQRQGGNWRRMFAVRPANGFGWKPAVSVVAACVTVIAAIVISVPDRPAVPSVQEGSKIETLEPEQVERTLEDLEMLKQLSLPSVASSL
jgi:hypothetical protein